MGRPTLKVAAVSGPRSGLYRKGKLAKLLGPLLFVLFFLMVGEKPAAGFATKVDCPLNCEYNSTLSPLSGFCRGVLSRQQETKSRFQVFDTLVHELL